VVKNCAKKLSDLSNETVPVSEDVIPKLEFVIEQLLLMIAPVHGRRYSPQLLWSSLSWMKSGPALYKILASGGSLTLPSVSRLQQLSSAYRLETGFDSIISFVKKCYIP